MAAPTTSARAAYAKEILRREVRPKVPGHGQEGIPAPPRVPQVDRDVRSDRICIIGAGTCGLYLAMMLKSFGFTKVDILEANDQVGGRCYTWPKTDEPQSGQIDHFYYDVGAMRIPQVPWMAGTLHFIQNTLGLKTPAYIYDLPGVPVSYWYKNDTISHCGAAFAAWLQPSPDPTYTGPDPKPMLYKDNFSTRAWLMNKVPPVGSWTYADTAKAELYDTSTGLFDQSLTETVIDYADFHYKKSGKQNLPWFRIEGGMQLVPETMANMLASTTWPKPDVPSWKVTLNTPVTKLAYDAPSKTVSVETAGGGTTTSYDMVFNTTAMGPLQRMDLSGLNLPNTVLDAIRSLSYDRATKVAIKFKKAWWTTDYGIVGGVSSSDLPISNVVYPSWNDNDGESPAVLMVSYAWAQDATRMASMVADYTVPGVKRTPDDAIVTLCLKDLVQLFKGRTPELTFDYLKGLVEDDPSDAFGPYHAWAWSHDPWTGGAFALFGPGQFQNIYAPCQALFCPDAPDRPGYHFAMAGEALSAHHAWICGAFDSAYTTLWTWLQSLGQQDLVDKLQDSCFGDGQGKHVQELDEDLFGWVMHFSKEVWAEEEKEKKLAVGLGKPTE
ncbi:L-amino acid oxidase [Apodospora peruviana]|uniref:L-amino acid oxidase n=1 Tax=Apodospora peruviana TaxID=516989 RepID=A0AAE0IAT2_9PEZI|nr:L-amino acid oxidase [Apodospora peruviana]